jgi:hypothetical protein
MKLQSLVDSRIGKLWQERHRYAGSVMSKAASLKDVEKLTSADINGLVNRYAAWLMTNLTEAGYATMVNGDAHAAATEMIGDVCTKIYQRANQSIIKTHPELVDCAVAGNCSDPAAPVEPPATQSVTKSAQNHQADLKKLMHQNLALLQKIDILETSATPMSVPANTLGPVHIGAYRNETDAHRAHHLLKQIDHYLLNSVFFNFEPQQRRTAIYYNLVSAPLSKHHVSALCAILWQQKMGCSASFAP